MVGGQLDKVVNAGSFYSILSQAFNPQNYDGINFALRLELFWSSFICSPVIIPNAKVKGGNCLIYFLFGGFTRRQDGRRLRDLISERFHFLGQVHHDPHFNGVTAIWMRKRNQTSAMYGTYYVHAQVSDS